MIKIYDMSKVNELAHGRRNFYDINF